MKGRSLPVRRVMRAMRIALALLVVAALAVTAAILPYRVLLPAASIPERREGELRIHFLDVGQGDCTFVEFPKGDVFVVDAGDGSFENDNRVVSYLRGLNPRSLTLAVTHADVDHYGGCAEILRVFDVERIFLPPVSAQTEQYKRFLAAVEKDGCAQRTFARYVSYVDRSRAYLICLSPHAEGETDENESAAMLYLSYGGVRVLLASDASSEREEAMLKEYAISPDIFSNVLLDVDLAGVDILKVAHHGSANSSGEAWLDLLRPKEAVISCGQGNSYGHPAGETLSRLAAVGASCYRTDELGTIVVSIMDGGYTISYGS